MALAPTFSPPTACFWSADGAFLCRESFAAAPKMDKMAGCTEVSCDGIAPLKRRALLGKFWAAAAASPQRFKNTACSSQPPGAIAILPGVAYTSFACTGASMCAGSPVLLGMRFKVKIAERWHALRFVVVQDGVGPTFKPAYCLRPLSAPADDRKAAMLTRVVAHYAAIQRPSAFAGELPLPPADAFVVRIVPASTPYAPGADGKYPAAAFVPTPMGHVDGRYTTIVHGKRFQLYGGDPARFQRVALEIVRYADEALDLVARLKCVNTQARTKYLVYCPDTYTEIKYQAERQRCLPCSPADFSAGYSGRPSNFCVVGQSDGAMGLDAWTGIDAIVHELGHAALGVGEAGAQWLSQTAYDLAGARIRAGGVLKTGPRYSASCVKKQFSNSGIAADIDDWRETIGARIVGSWSVYDHFHFWMYVSASFGIEGVSCMLDAMYDGYPRGRDAAAAKRGRSAVKNHSIRWVEALALATGATPADVLEQYVRDTVAMGAGSALPKDAPARWEWFAAGTLAGGRWTPTSLLQYHGFLVVDVASFARGRRVRWSSDVADRFRVVAFADGRPLPGLVAGEFAVPAAASGSAWLAFAAVALPDARTAEEMAVTARPTAPPSFVVDVL